MQSTRIPQTLAQKLIAKAAGRRDVQLGEIVNCRIDLAMFHDSSGPRRLAPMLKELNADIWDPSKVVLIMDHYVPASDPDAIQIVQIARDWSREQQLPNVYDSIGICHVVLPQKGHIKPGMFCVGGDSHSTTAGAFGAYMFGVGSTEMLGAVVTGEIWVKVPQTILMDWQGVLSDGVSAKDMVLHMVGQLGMNGGNYQAIEFAGSAVSQLSMQERMTLSNMSAELGAQVGLIAPDKTTFEWLAKHHVNNPIEIDDWFTDPDAPVIKHTFDASQLVPQVAFPHSPANTHDITQIERIPVQVAYIGGCTGAKLDDLAAAARILKNRHIAPGMQLMVAPASAQDQSEAESLGYMNVLRHAGAVFLPNACGACSGYGGSIPEGVNVIASTARNFKGRMGSATAQVYLGSPYTVAASAINGVISDPREFL